METTTVKIELSPCPFCGCSDIYLGRGGIACPVPDACGTWGYVAGCMNQKCNVIVMGPRLPDDYASRPASIAEHKPQALAETAAKWNRRST